MVDNQHAPLLYGPYVIFRELQDGRWVRVHYESKEKHKQLIKLPYHAGWTIESIKTVNWRYWTLTLRNPKTKQLEDFILFVGGSLGHAGNLQPFLGARCVDCLGEASHACGTCLEMAFCEKHAEAHAHRESCWNETLWDSSRKVPNIK
jgi:hypothetical protein